VPEGWSIHGLDEIARFLNGLAMQKYPPHGDRSLPVIRSLNCGLVPLMRRQGKR
jgi:type I restriction enzyme S subunit